MLYTILDPNEVLADVSGTKAPQFEWLKRDGCILQCVRREDSLFLDRLISTNPKDYLNEQYKIGSQIQK